MLVQRHFNPQIAQRLETISAQELEKLLEIKKEQALEESTEPSKWAKIAQDAHDESPLDGLSEYVMKDVAEFRDNFHMKND